MPVASFKHGITITEVTSGGRALAAVSTAIIGLVATAEDADATLFPLDRPALITDVEAAIAKAGTTGTLAPSLRAIADQTRPILIVVRVAEGDDDAETASNVIGTTTAEGEKTGMQALLVAEAIHGVKPKILGTPGLETQAVTTALAIIAKKLRGFAYARVVGDTVTAATTYRGGFAQRELMLLMPDFLSWDTATSASITSFAAARAMGLRALIDDEYGPQKTLSNIAVQGVTGISQDIQWDIEDQDTEAGLLNAAEVTALIRTPTGFRFWGNRTTADDPAYAFESTVRVAQLVADTVARGMLWAMDKPLTPALARDIIETVDGFLAELQRAGVILGRKCWYDEAKNSTASLNAGKLRISYKFTVPSPLEDLGFQQEITDEFYVDFGSQLGQAA